MRFTSLPLLSLFVLAASTQVSAGPIAWGVCQTACNAGVVVCYAAAGLTFGTVTIVAGPVSWWAWLFGGGATAATGAAAACSAVQGACMSACTPLLIAPTP
ncbi:UNVERIFIED_CONTAM: hypothetical protein HDU68_001522 [Siphonaria sp. JEL0065]|nr:hypothetical protein HDU68_001522 [Siphonaria sp. JEL0065]